MMRLRTILRSLELGSYRPCVKSVFLYICFILIFSGDVPGRAGGPFDILPDSSASSAEGSFSSLVNPVFPDVNSAPMISYMAQNYRDQESFNHIFLLNTMGFTFSYIWFNDLYNRAADKVESARTNYFKIGKGFFWDNNFGIGVDYTATRSGNSDYDGYRSLSFGMLFRPFRFISFGFVARDLNNPDIGGRDVGRREIYSVSVRPFRDYLTVSFDAGRREGRDFHKSDFLFSADLRLLYGISLFAGSDLNKNFTFGMTLPLGTGPSSLVFDGYTSQGRSGAPASMLFAASISGLKDESFIVPAGRFLKVDMQESINELEAEGLWGERRIIFYDILNAVRTAGDDDSIKGIILQIDETALGFARLQELREELRILKGKGKKIYSILMGPGNPEYFLASVSDRIYFAPSSYFLLTGLKAEVYFFKKLLDKIGVNYESIKSGKYKSFNESFTREHMSPEFRENLLALISDLNSQYLEEILRDRNLGSEQLERILKGGIMSPGEALEAGVVDEVMYPLDAMKHIVGTYNVPGMVVDADNYIREKFAIREWGRIPSIAVIYVSGSIVRGKTGSGMFSSNAVGDETYREAAFRAFNDRSVKAVVIRVDSPGGSATASDFMWHYLVSMKERHPEKPVVFSFGNTAASGGYFIASTGDTIFSNSGTITGSIGVISGKLSLEKLYATLGINKDTVKMSEFADLYTESRDLSDAERAAIQKGVDLIYERFTGKVADYRGIDKAKLSEVAEGRVFSGRQAGRNKLIDRIGGLLSAIEFARVKAGVEGMYNIKHLPERKAPIMELFDEGAEIRLSAKIIEDIFRGMNWIDFADERELYYFPYRIVIK